MTAFNNTNHSVINVDKLIYVDNLEFLASIDSNIRYIFEQVDIYIAINIKLHPLRHFTL
jgi:dTDP-D-glucose 4,6-dehydratase